MKMKIGVGDTVMVYDRYRLGNPAKAIVVEVDWKNNIIKVRFSESPYAFIIKYTCVHYQQLRLVEKHSDPGPGGIGID